MTAVHWTHHIISLIYIFCSWLLLSFQPREDFSSLIAIYAACFAGYLLIVHFKKASFRYVLNVAIITHVGALLFIPHLSNDIFRFLWDGSITWMGENPFDSTPNELWTQTKFNRSEYLSDLRAGMSDLSKQNYTCYPTINQFYFVAATSFSNSIVVQSIALKILIIVTQGFGIVYFVKLLQHFSLKKYRIFLLLLNPLWLLETVGNSHFEGVMLSFFVIGLYALVHQKWMFGALFIAFAIHIKLVPIFLLPFLFRYLGWKRATIVYSTTTVFVLAFGLVYLDTSNFMNFVDSITLYFRAFEFNSSIYFVYLEMGLQHYGWYPIRTYGYQLSQVSTFLILVLSVYGDFYDFKTMLKRMMFALLIYYLFASTVHPWYVLTLLGLSIFTQYSFGVIWSLFVVLSYAAYGTYSHETLRNLITIEYAVLLVAVGYEIIRKRPLLKALSFQESSESRVGTGS